MHNHPFDLFTTMSTTVIGQMCPSSSHNLLSFSLGSANSRPKNCSILRDMGGRRGLRRPHAALAGPSCRAWASRRQGAPRADTRKAAIPRWGSGRRHRETSPAVCPRAAGAGLGRRYRKLRMVASQPEAQKRRCASRKEGRVGEQSSAALEEVVDMEMGSDGLRRHTIDICARR